MTNYCTNQKSLVTLRRTCTHDNHSLKKMNLELLKHVLNLKGYKEDTDICDFNIGVFSHAGRQWCGGESSTFPPEDLSDNQPCFLWTATGILKFQFLFSTKEYFVIYLNRAGRYSMF